MNDFPEPGSEELELEPDHHRRHRHKRKRRTRKKLYRQLIIGMVFILVCAGALLAWHFLVQEPPRHSSVVAGFPR